MTPETTPPFIANEAACFRIDYVRLERHLGFYAGCNVVIANPGAEVDLLAMTGRLDLVRDYVDFLRRRFSTVTISIHHAGPRFRCWRQQGSPSTGTSPR